MKHYLLAHSRIRGISAPIKTYLTNGDVEIQYFSTFELAHKQLHELNSKTNNPHVFYTYGGLESEAIQ